MPTKKKPAASPRPLLQWGMALLGAVINLTAIGIVVWEALQPTAPPALSARIVAVDIEGVLGDQTATASLDYVPGHGHAKAYLRFDADPRAAAVSVKGWSAP